MRNCLILLFVLLTFGVSAQDEWYLGKPITDIQFSGLDTVNDEELLPLVRPYLSEPFSLDIFWEIQEKLYQLEYFESIEGNALPGDDQNESVIVEFKVVERPTVSKIVIEGNRKIRQTEIMGTILTKEGDMISDTQVSIDADSINLLYLEKGYEDTQINGELDLDEEDNTVVVTFKVVEGLQTTIKTISFSGNSFAAESTLRKTMKTKSQAFFASGVFQESKLEEDLQRIREYYWQHGFVDAEIEKVDRQVEKDVEKGRNYLNLTLYISEGEQYIYGGMTFEGNVIFSDGQLAELVRQKPGKILDLSKLEADFQRVADLYFENGYIFNVINRRENRDEKRKEIKYTVSIIEQGRAHIENILIKGNDKTKDYVILRELPFDEGDIFSKTKVLQGLRNLYNLQFFSIIEPETPPGSAEGLMDLVLNVEEGSTANINFGVTFSGGDYPISGTLKWAENNFLGRGQTLGVDSEISNLRQLLSLRFEEPWMFGYRWLGGVNLSFEHAIVPNIPQDILPPIFNGDEDFAVPDPYGDEWWIDNGDGTFTLVTGTPDPDIHITDYEKAIREGKAIPSQYLMDYTIWKIAAGVTTGYRYLTPLGWLGALSSLSTSLELLTYDDIGYRPFDPDVRDHLANWDVINKLYLKLYWDRRDYFLNPAKGTYLGQGFSYTGGILFGNRDFIRSDTTLEAFATLFDIPATENWNFKMVLAAHSALSIIFPQFNGDENTLTTDLLYIDGWNVARGWPLQKDKTVLWDNRLELRMPIAEQFLWWVFYFDMVAGYDQRSDFFKDPISLDDFLFGFGGGIRFSIPQFPIRMYIGKRFSYDYDQARDRYNLNWQDGPLFGGWGVDFVISLGGDTF